MRRWTVIAGLLGAAVLLLPARAHAYCAPETSPCYRWDRYSYIGTSWCRHWNFGVYDQVYCVNSTTEIGPLTFRDAAAAAYRRWANQVGLLPQLSFSALPGDTTNNSYMKFVDDATWIAQGLPSNAGAVSYEKKNPDGTVQHGRTWFHLKSSSWGWLPDCLGNDCTSNPPFTPGKLDFPSIAGHEIGHWWVLLDVSAGGCEHVLMWFQMSINQVKRDPQFPDVYGATLLYDQPVDVAVSLAGSDAQPDRVALVWYLADPGQPTATVERRTAQGSWETHAIIAPEGTGYLHFTDTDIVPGGRYGYRLRIPGRTGDVWSAETWVDVPGWALALDPVQPNPTRGSDLRVRFVLPADAPAFLEVLDVAGRFVQRLNVSDLGRGAHVLSIGTEAPLRAGLYWLRLTQGRRALTTRAVVVR